MPARITPIASKGAVLAKTAPASEGSITVTRLVACTTNLQRMSGSSGSLLLLCVIQRTLIKMFPCLPQTLSDCADKLNTMCTATSFSKLLQKLHFLDDAFSHKIWIKFLTNIFITKTWVFHFLAAFQNLLEVHPSWARSHLVQ